MKNILMNVPMTKAILEGRKTQTRRVIKCSDSWNPCLYGELYKMKNDDFVLKNGEPIFIGNGFYNEDGDEGYLPKYQKDEVIWVREPAEVIAFDNETLELCYRFKADDGIQAKSILIPGRLYKKRREDYADYPLWAYFCQGIPNGCIKEMARIFLKVTDVRVERLQDISLEDMLKEGINHIAYLDMGNVVKSSTQIKREWIALWNSTAPKGYQWEDNPYVFVYEFERVEK